MKRKVLTVLCVLVLLLGAFGFAAAAEQITAAAMIGETPYETLQDAVSAVKNGYKNGLIVLQQPVDSVEIDCDVYVDLNGKDIGSLTVNNGTFYGMDSQTDDYTVKDTEGYGKIKVTCEGTGKVVGLPEESDLATDGYLMVTEDDGTSFHRVNLQIHTMTLRAEDLGVYYKSYFAGDELVAERVEKFGVVMSVVGEPTVDNLKKDNGSYSWFTGFEAGQNNDDNTSTLLRGVMKRSNANMINVRNANLPVYGRSYILLKDGTTYMLGGCVQRTFREQVEGVDARWDTLSEEQKLAMLKMYNAYKDAMTNWEIPNIVEADAAFHVQNFFESKTFENNDTVLPYRIYVPYNYDPEKEYPLLVHLHGAGYRGTDNRRPLNSLNPLFKMPELEMEQAIVIVPQCPEDEQWVDTPWSLGSYSLDSVPESNELKAVIELIGQVRDTYSVDSKRIYASGFSMGGYGTWNLLMNHSDLFCAAVAMCGAADPSKAGVLVDTPIWAIHGTLDTTVPVSGSQEMVAAIQAAGGQNINYTELPEHAHDVWTYTFSNYEIFEWLFKQVKE